MGSASDARGIERGAFADFGYGGSASGKTRIFSTDDMHKAWTALYGANPCSELVLGEAYRSRYGRSKEDEARLVMEGSIGEGSIQAMTPDEHWAFMRDYARASAEGHRLLQERGDISAMRPPGAEEACDLAARQESVRLYCAWGGWSHVESIMRTDAALAQAARERHTPPCTNKRSRPWRAAEGASSRPSRSKPSAIDSSKRAEISPPWSPSRLLPPKKSSDGRFSFGLEWFSAPSGSCVRELSIDALAWLSEGAV